MAHLRILAIFLATLYIHIMKTSADVDPNLTVDNANAYIEKNKDTVNQTYRLKYHPMAPIGWINDPNGFIFFQGEYHLFYQYNPYNAYATKVHWGHKKSKDLIVWEDLPVALAPDHDYDSEGVWSGSAIEKDGKLYVMYAGNTGHGQVQCIAVSEDGINFDKIEQNPVLDETDLPDNAQHQDFRDPKVFKRGDLYYAVIVSKTVDETGQVLLYQSDDLIDWTFKSILLKGTKEQGSMWECPDLFVLDGKDVLLLSATEMPRSGYDYNNLDSVIEFVGEVDWEEGTFKVESTKEVDHGMDFYATQTTSDDQGRRIMTGWMNMWGRNYPTADQGWAGAMILPSELSIEDGVLVQKPITEIANYYEKMAEYSNTSIQDGIWSFENVTGKVVELEIQVNLEEAEHFEIHLRAYCSQFLVSCEEKTVLAYNKTSSELILDRSQSGIEITGEENPQVTSRRIVTPLIDNRLKLQIFLDTSSVEVFVNDGKESFTATIYPTHDTNLIYFVVVGTANVESLILNNINVEK